MFRSGLNEIVAMSLKSKSLPRDVLEDWIAFARDSGNVQPDAMVLATADAKGKPSARVVLYKGWHEKGVLFVTNYESRKSRELLNRSAASLCFYWTELNRQIRLTGRVMKASRSISEHYFSTRPRESQLGAWASRQSQSIQSYEILMQCYTEMDEKFKGKDVPCPPHWGGFFLQPATAELWVGQVGRLHQRVLYTRKGTQWHAKWLSP